MNNLVREEIVEWISKPENEDLLETLKLMKEASSKDDWFDELSEEDVASVEKGIKNQEEGKTLSSQEFWKRNAL